MRQSHLCVSIANSFQKSLGCRKATGFAKLAVPALTCPLCHDCLSLPIRRYRQWYPVPALASPSSEYRASWSEQHCVRRARADTPVSAAWPTPPHRPSRLSGWLRHALRSHLLELSALLTNPSLKVLLPEAPSTALTKLPQTHHHDPFYVHLWPLSHVCISKRWYPKPLKCGVYPPF